MYGSGWYFKGFDEPYTTIPHAQIDPKYVLHIFNLCVSNQFERLTKSLRISNLDHLLILTVYTINANYFITLDFYRTVIASCDLFFLFFFIKIKMIGASNTAQDMCESITVLITIYGNVRPVSIWRRVWNVKWPRSEAAMIFSLSLSVASRHFCQ